MRHAREDYNHIQDPSGRIPEDEPVFLLRAQDATAAQVVRYWASLQDPDCGLTGPAREQADKMELWRPQKMPCGPHSTKPD